MTTSLAAYQLLEKLALQQIGVVAIPTHFSIVIRLRNALNDPSAPFKKIVDILHGEPTVSAYVVQAANVASLYSSTKILDVEKAVNKLGTSAVRRIALGVAMSQLAKSKELLPFANLARTLWLNSLYTAAAATVLAEHLTTQNHEEALFTGLMINLGAFYMLYLASQHEASRASLSEVRSAVLRHYLSLTGRVLDKFGFPQEFLDVLKIDDLEGGLQTAPKSKQELVYAAHRIAMVKYPWTEEEADLEGFNQMYIDLSGDIDARFHKLQEEFK